MALHDKVHTLEVQIEAYKYATYISTHDANVLKTPYSRSMIQMCAVGPTAKSETVNVNALPPTNKVLLKQLDRADYPAMKYWTRGDFGDRQTPSAHVTTTTKSKKKNTQHQYIEDEDGQPVSWEYAQQMVDYTRHIFTEFRRRKIDAETFKKLGVVSMDFYRASMYTRFPILRGCHGDWKADKLGSESYHAWYRPERQAKKATKQEDLEGVGVPSNRRVTLRQPSTGRDLKEVKEEGYTSVRQFDIPDICTYHCAGYLFRDRGGSGNH